MLCVTGPLLKGYSETSTQFVPENRAPWICAHQPPPDQRLLQEIDISFITHLTVYFSQKRIFIDYSGYSIFPSGALC